MNKAITLLISLILLFSTNVNADIPADLVQNLQSINITYGHPIYSGYLNTSIPARKLHYMFFPSQNQPKTDPVLLWLNGGPGCSSMLGAFQEHGPIIFMENSSLLINNSYSWNQQASVLYIESPAGVGFSTTDNNINDDNSTAQQNLEALLNFFQNYDEYLNNDFFISGESYGGIYVPLLSYWVHVHNQNVSQSGNGTKLNFKGFAVGNGCVHPSECAYVLWPHVYDYLNNVGFIPSDLWSQYQQNCPFDQIKEPTKVCMDIVDQIDANRQGINGYDVYGYCYHQSSSQQKVKYVMQQREFQKSVQDSNGTGAPDCVDAMGPYNYFNNDTVKEAFHVNKDIHWQMCSDDVYAGYTRLNGSYYVFPALIENNYRILIYSGNTDSAVPITGTLYWLQLIRDQMQLEEITIWRPWFQDGTTPQERQNAGTFWQFEGITFVSFKGAGHMVPQQNRQGSLDMINVFLNGTMTLPWQ